MPTAAILTLYRVSVQTMYRAPPVSVQWVSANLDRAPYRMHGSAQCDTERRVSVQLVNLTEKKLEAAGHTL